MPLDRPVWKPREALWQDAGRGNIAMKEMREMDFVGASGTEVGRTMMVE
jgi:hypothetical protein